MIARTVKQDGDENHDACNKREQVRIDLHYDEAVFYALDQHGAQHGIWKDLAAPAKQTDATEHSSCNGLELVVVAKLGRHRAQLCQHNDGSDRRADAADQVNGDQETLCTKSGLASVFGAAAQRVNLP